MIHHPLLRLRLAFVLIPLLLSSAAFAQPESKSETTVFHLKHAVASDVAQTLQAMLENELGPATTRIIPEPRMNALFITAPEEVMKQIEQLLDILDADVPREEEEIKVFALQNSDAASAQQVVSELFGVPLRIQVDERTNSLIAIGDAEQLEVLETVLLRLDESNARAHHPQVIPFEIRHIPVRKLTDILRDLGIAANLAFDDTGNRLLVSGDAATVAVIEKMVKLLDAPEEKVVGQPIQLRLVWLVEESLAGVNAAAPAGNLEKPLKVLEDRLGLTNLKTAAQFLVSIDPDAQGADSVFTARGTAEFMGDMLADLEVEGIMTGQSDGRPVIELNIHAQATQTVVINRGGPQSSGRSSRSSNELAGLSTVVTAPIGHSVVLGVTSIRSAASVFVLQVLPADGP